MKIKFTLLFIFLLCFALIKAEEISFDKAKIVAENFYGQMQKSTIKDDIQINLTLISDIFNYPKLTYSKKSLKEQRFFYVFQVNENDGFIIIAADDKMIPILGYSLNGKISSANIPPAFKKWMESYKEQIFKILNNPQQNTEVLELWDRLLNNQQYAPKKSLNTVSPLLTTMWNQSPYYNDLCPYDYNANKNAVVGCVATAMAQIIKYWEYPARGRGFHSYNHDEYGTISANFSETEYEWNKMPNVLFNPDSNVATLMYHCGVSVEMDYGVGGSSAYIISARSPIQHCAEYALEKYFGYDNTLGGY